MKIIYGKDLTPSDIKVIRNISEECGILFDTARLLYYRNIDTVEKAKAFLSAGKKGFNNPFLFNHMQSVCDRIKKAKDNSENVLIFGDYDVDGICAVATLYFALKEYGIVANVYVPERDNGYGLNFETLSRLNADKKIDLLITVDCGISEKDNIDLIKKMGIDCIVTDHHEPPTDLPDCLIINPKVEGEKYPFKGLCGAGVAYKLGYALIGEKADKYIDLVATATVADSMDLIDENRDIVTVGLAIFNNPKTLRYQFKCILGDNNRQITAQTIAYSIAPRINAGGRMGDANCALKLFISQDDREIFDLAVLLNQYNIARQQECDNIYRQAKSKIQAGKKFKNNVIVVSDPNWRIGFIGIVAARLVEDYSKPVIVFAGHDGFLKGSARSIDGINIYEAIDSLKDMLIGYGGHSQAAGVSISVESFDAFDRAINSYIMNQNVHIDSEHKIFADWNIDKEISIQFAKEISILEPFGVGNKKPQFTIDATIVESAPIKQGSPHYTFNTRFLDVLDFNGEKNVLPLSLPIDKKLVIELDLSVFKGRESLKGYLRNVVLSYNQLDKLTLFSFSKSLDEILKENSEYTLVDSVDILNKRLGRTVYAFSDPKNLALYPTINKLPKGVFVDNIKGGEDVVIINPCEEIGNYSQVVYLDRPISLVKRDVPIYVCKNVCGYKFLSKVDASRQALAVSFKKLIALSGKKVINDANFISKYFNNEDCFQMIFALKVFKELNILDTDSGTLIYNQKVKNELTNSLVYSKICLLKEENV